jgi:FtsH-binding integral membrane protein
MQNLYAILILLTAFPVGLILSWLTKEELKPGRKWFLALSVISFIAIVALSFLRRNPEVILALFYIIIVCLVSLWKSYDSK